MAWHGGSKHVEVGVQQLVLVTARCRLRWDEAGVFVGFGKGAMGSPRPVACDTAHRLVPMPGSLDSLPHSFWQGGPSWEATRTCFEVA